MQQGTFFYPLLWEFVSIEQRARGGISESVDAHLKYEWILPNHLPKNVAPFYVLSIHSFIHSLVHLTNIHCAPAPCRAHCFRCWGFHGEQEIVLVLMERTVWPWKQPQTNKDTNIRHVGWWEVLRENKACLVLYTITTSGVSLFFLLIF